MGQFEYLSREYHQSNINVRPIEPFQTAIGVDIEIPIFPYTTFVKFHTIIVNCFQTDMKNSVYRPALVVT